MNIQTHEERMDAIEKLFNTTALTAMERASLIELADRLDRNYREEKNRASYSNYGIPTGVGQQLKAIQADQQKTVQS